MSCEHWVCSGCDGCSCEDLEQCRFEGTCTECCVCSDDSHDGPAG